MLYNLYMTIDCYLYSDYPYEGAYTCDQPNYDVNEPRIKQLFWENYEYVKELEAQGKARPIVLDTLQQALLCRTEYLGYDAFERPNCGNEYVVYHHCHCKLCPSCGVKTQRKKSIVSKILTPAFDGNIVKVLHEDERSDQDKRVNGRTHCMRIQRSESVKDQRRIQLA